jgi:DNA-binding IscR family transcriptional regulator
VFCLAKQSGQPTAARSLGAANGVPASYQSKIHQGLRQGGIVEAHRGTGCGILLARRAERLTITDVIDAVNRPWFAGAGPNATDPLATLRQRLSEGVRLMLAVFASISIGNLCRDPAAVPGTPPPDARSEPGKRGAP